MSSNEEELEPACMLDSWVYMSTYCGPEREDGGNRTRVELTCRGRPLGVPFSRGNRTRVELTGADEGLSLSIEQARAVLQWLQKVLS